MANEFYISAGLVPNDSGETQTANTFYISAGLVPDDAESGSSTISPINLNGTPTTNQITWTWQAGS